MAISDKNIRITKNTNTAVGIYPKIVFTGSSAGSSVLTLEVRDDNTVAFTGIDGDVFSLDYNLSTGIIWSVNDKSGINLLSASAGATIGIAEFGNSTLRVGSGNIGATSLSGTLLVKGGIGITGNAFIGGTTTITSIASATGASSGALVVYGGASVGGTLHVGNMVKVGNLNYAATNVVAAFASSVPTFNQVILQNTSGNSGASADYVISNDVSTDSTFYGNFGMNSSTFTGTGALNAASAVYVTATSSSLVLGTTTSNPIRFVVNSGTSDLMFFEGAGTAISVNTNFDMRAANTIRFFNATSTFSTALKGGNNPANYTLTLPTALPGAGVSILVSDSTGTMSFPTISGIGISIIGSGTAITFSHSTPLTTYFCSGYTPNNTGTDSVVYMVPFSTVDGTTSVTYSIRRVHMRVETPSAGTSTIKLEKYAFNAGTGVTVFSNSSIPAVGSTANIMNPLGLSISGAAIAETFVTAASIGFSTGFATCVSGDKFRVNFTAINATHANFSISMTMDSSN